MWLFLYFFVKGFLDGLTASKEITCRQFCHRLPNFLLRPENKVWADVEKEEKTTTETIQASTVLE